MCIARACLTQVTTHEALIIAGSGIHHHPNLWITERHPALEIPSGYNHH
jgi:hypothetical protein